MIYNSLSILVFPQFHSLLSVHAGSVTSASAFRVNIYYPIKSSTQISLKIALIKPKAVNSTMQTCKEGCHIKHQKYMFSHLIWWTSSMLTPVSTAARLHAVIIAVGTRGYRPTIIALQVLTWRTVQCRDYAHLATDRFIRLLRSGVKFRRFKTIRFFQRRLVKLAHWNIPNE